MDAALRNGSLDEAVTAVDAVLFQDEGIARGEMTAARTALHERRRTRARSLRSRSPKTVPPHLELDRVLSRVCTALRVLP